MANHHQECKTSTKSINTAVHSVTTHRHIVPVFPQCTTMILYAHTVLLCPGEMKFVKYIWSEGMSSAQDLQGSTHSNTLITIRLMTISWMSLQRFLLTIRPEPFIIMAKWKSLLSSSCSHSLTEQFYSPFYAWCGVITVITLSHRGSQRQSRFMLLTSGLMFHKVCECSGRDSLFVELKVVRSQDHQAERSNLPEKGESDRNQETDRS